MTMRALHRAKHRLHRDIVADPVLHGRVLNMYLNGEQYPHRVAGYFPMAAVEDAALEQRMRAHLREEDKHVALYSKAIRELGQAVTELPLQDVYNTVIRKHTPPLEEPPRSTDRKRLELAHFLAHLHFLESRIARSLEDHAEACARSAAPYVAKAVRVILADEKAHAAYTREALFAVLPGTVARSVLEVHREAEARADREFSARELRRLLSEEGHRFPPVSRAMYHCAALLQGGRSRG